MLLVMPLNFLRIFKDGVCFLLMLGNISSNEMDEIAAIWHAQLVAQMVQKKVRSLH